MSAVSVHGTCRVLGTLLVGFFAVDGGLFYGGNAHQLIAQVIGVASVCAWDAVSSGVLFLVLKKTIGLRVNAHEEHEGLDVMEHGLRGYNPEIYTGDFIIEDRDERVPISQISALTPNGS